MSFQVELIVMLDHVMLDHVISYRISDAVLQSQFTEISKLLMEKLTCYERSSSTALLKSVSGSHELI